MTYVNTIERHGLAKGRQEGSMTALEGALHNQVKLKFGEVPAWVEQRIQHANDRELSTWVVQIVSADSLEALLDT